MFQTTNQMMMLLMMMMMIKATRMKATGLGSLVPAPVSGS